MVNTGGFSAGTCNQLTVHAWRPQSGTKGLWHQALGGCGRAPTALLKASSGKGLGRGGSASMGAKSFDGRCRQGGYSVKWCLRHARQIISQFVCLLVSIARAFLPLVARC